MTCSVSIFVDGIDVGTGVEKHRHDFDTATFSSVMQRQRFAIQIHGTT
jgi:hypothetical protein